MTPLRYHEAAEEELLNEIGYLELQAHGLGRRFFAEIRRAEDRIAQFPESAQEICPGIRKRMLRTFQYSIIYALEPNGALVLAVAHYRRRPGYWAGRLTR
jgi:plasmid stabilization system protein ParE